MVSVVTLLPGLLSIFDNVALWMSVASEMSLIVTLLRSSNDFFSINAIKWYLIIVPPHLPDLNHNWFCKKKARVLRIWGVK